MACKGKSVKNCTKSSCCLLLYFVSYFAFLLLGGWIFVAIEHDHDKSKKGELKKELIGVLKKHNISINGSMAQELIIAAAKAYDIGAIDIDHINDKVDVDSSWNLGAALFFCATVVTTIGYGNLFPLTKSGRIFCIFYALMGIPLTGLLMAKVGTIMTKVMRKADHRIEVIMKPILGTLVKSGETKKHIRIAQLVVMTVVVILFFWLIPAAFMVHTEGWDYTTAAYFCLISITTIGLGDVVPGSSSGGQFVGGHLGIANVRAIVLQVSVIVYLLLGLSALTIILNLIRSLAKMVADSAVSVTNNAIEGAAAKVGKTEAYQSIHRKVSQFTNKGLDDDEGTSEENSQRRVSVHESKFLPDSTLVAHPIIGLCPSCRSRKLTSDTIVEEVSETNEQENRPKESVSGQTYNINNPQVWNFTWMVPGTVQEQPTTSESSTDAEMFLVPKQRKYTPE